MVVHWFYITNVIDCWLILVRTPSDHIFNSLRGLPFAQGEFLSLVWARTTFLSVRNRIIVGYLFSKVFSLILFAAICCINSNLIWCLFLSTTSDCLCRLRNKSFIILMPQAILPNALNHPFMVLNHLLFLSLPLFVLVLHFATSFKFFSTIRIFKNCSSCNIFFFLLRLNIFTLRIIILDWLFTTWRYCILLQRIIYFLSRRWCNIVYYNIIVLLRFLPLHVFNILLSMRVFVTSGLL